MLDQWRARARTHVVRIAAVAVMVPATLAVPMGTGSANAALAVSLHSGFADVSTYYVSGPNSPGWGQNTSRFKGTVGLGGVNYLADLVAGVFSCPGNPATTPCGSHLVGISGTVRKLTSVAGGDTTTAKWVEGQCLMPYFQYGVATITCQVSFRGTSTSYPLNLQVKHYLAEGLAEVPIDLLISVLDCLGPYGPYGGCVGLGDLGVYPEGMTYDATYTQV